MEVLDAAPSHGVHLDAKNAIGNSENPSSSGSLIVASATPPNGQFSLGDEAAVDSYSAPRTPKYVASNGLSFSSVDEVLQALSAALEVNEHLRQQVEEKGNQVQALTAQVQAYEHRHAELQHRVRELEVQRTEESAVGKIAETSDKMDELMSRGLASPPEGFFQNELVSRRYEELLERGAREGWLMSASDIQMGAPIGAGTFGQTFAATWRGTKVAAKCAKPPQTTSEAINVLREIECFAAVTHPHVLPFLGACLSDADRCFLITELMPGGNLKEWLYGAPNGRRPVRRLSDRLCMALHVAQGMAGLEGAKPPIAHRDLKPSNVFVDAGGGARIADMNLSLRLHEDCLANLTGETGTYLYMSPEMMRHEVYTTKTDVWSFGVMLTELCNQELPYSSLYLTPLQVAIGVADRKLRPPLEITNIPDAIKRLLDSCLQQEPMLRPSFVFIASQLHPVVQALRASEARADTQPSLIGRMSSMLSGVAVQAGAAAAQAGAAAAHMREHQHAPGSGSTGARTPATLPPRPESIDRTPSGSRSQRSTGRTSVDGGRFQAGVNGARAQATSMFSGFMNRARAGMQR
eukprot:jgi/Ulvmu1/2322/UM013_0170.1